MQTAFSIEPDLADVVVYDICDNPARTVQYFLNKYHLSYADWSYLNRAALPAVHYKNEAREYFNKYNAFLASVQHILYTIQTERKTPTQIVKMLESAIQDSRMER